MDKYEYKVRAEEIKSLIEEHKYPEAMAIADTIDWRKVKSVSMLCDISDLYSVNRKFEAARDVLELAYERHPEGRRIVYSLCELSIKMEDIIQAVEYYKEFVKIAPRDSGRYILQYKIYQAQEVGIDECIAVLKELKSKDYREKWAYELAYLYHRAGLATECVEECDELILWFGEGTFVKKAMELKMLHMPLTASQKEKYDLMNRSARRVAEASRPAEPEIRVKPVDTSIYNTMNLQKELAMSLEAVLKKDKEAEEEVVAVHGSDTGVFQPVEMSSPEPAEESAQEEAFIELSDEEQPPEQEESIPAEQEESTFAEKEASFLEPAFEQEEQNLGDTKIFSARDMAQFKNLIPEDPFAVRTVQKADTVKETKPESQEEKEPAPKQVYKPQVEAPSGFEELLSQEYDGQISLVVPEEEPLDKQITGQLSIEDVLAEWERMKRENEQKRQEEVRQRVLEHTGNLMKEFDETAHEELEDFEQFENVEDEEESFEELEEIREDTEEEEAKEQTSESEEQALEFEEQASESEEQALEFEEQALESEEQQEQTSEEPKRMPYGANRFEYEEDESLSIPESKPVTRIVQDYNELLYGEDEETKEAAEEATANESDQQDSDFMEAAMFEESLFDENIAGDTATDTDKEEGISEDSVSEEMFDPQDFMNGMFEEEAAPEEISEPDSAEDTKSEEESFDFGEQFGFEEASVNKEQTVEQEAETEEEFTFNPEQYLTEDSASGDIEDSASDDIEASDEISRAVESAVKEAAEAEEAFVKEAEAAETETETEDEAEVEEAFGEPVDEIEKRMDALASKVFSPQEAFVSEEVPFTDTFTLITPDLQDQFVNGLSEVQQEAVEVPLEQPEVQKMEPSPEQSALQFEAQTPEVFEEETDDFEDQYSKALEEQLSSVVPSGFSGVDETAFERVETKSEYREAVALNPEDTFEQVEELGEEESSAVENFYERQAEIERNKNIREFTDTEEKLYGNFLRTKRAKEQLVYAIDNISMASYTGNIIITGEDQKENLELARNLLKEVQQNDSNFSGVPGKISADSLNRKDVASILQKVENGAVIIENAGSLSRETVESMSAYLEKENRGVIVILIDHKIHLDKMLSAYPVLRNNFNARIDIEEMTSQELSAYGKSYAYEKEYAIDDMGMLALFTRIDELQTRGHVVMPEEVERIIDAAIKKANRKNLRHFTDIIINKRYDEEDMIVLREKDF